jgi:hypothetical protein
MLLNEDYLNLIRFSTGKDITDKPVIINLFKLCTVSQSLSIYNGIVIDEAETNKLDVDARGINNTKKSTL